MDVLFEDHGALLEDVLDDGRLGGVDQRDEGVDLLAHADDGLEGAFGLVLEVVGAVLADEHLRTSEQRRVYREEDGGDILLAQGLGVLGRVSTDLAKAPGGGGLDVVLVVGA